VILVLASRHVLQMIPTGLDMRGGLSQ